MPVSRLLTAHFRQLVGLEGAAYVALTRAYQQFVDDATAITAAQTPAGDSVAEVHRDAILVQVQTALDVLATATVETLGEHLLAAANTGAAQQIAEIRDLEARFGSMDVLSRIATIPPVIPAESVAYVAQAGNLALTDFRNSTAERVADSLAQSILQGDGIDAATRRLATTMDAHRWELERIARTEINTAMNYGHEATIQRVADDIPEAGLQKRWSSHFDSRTSAICRALGADGGQVRNLDEDFETTAGGGWRGAYPPAHPNCRSRVLAWCARWASAAAKMLSKAREMSPTCLHTFALLQGRSRPPGGAKARDMTTKKDTRERKSYAVEFKALDEPGTFSGYASVFGNVDHGGDIVHSGAFKRTLSHYRQSKKRIPLLYSHETGLNEVVGYVDPDDLAEDGKGLQLKKGVLLVDELESARKAHVLMKNGVLTTMSFGYDAIKKDFTGGVRNLREVKLYEISLVLWPMNEESQVTDVKGATAPQHKAADFATILRREEVETDLWNKRWKMQNALSDAIHGALCDEEMSEADAIALVDDSLSQYQSAMLQWARVALASGVYTKTADGLDEAKSGRRLSAATRAQLEGMRAAAMKQTEELDALLADPESPDPAGNTPGDSEEKGGPGPGETSGAAPVKDHAAALLTAVRAWTLTA